MGADETRTGVVVASSASNVAEEQGKGKATNAGPIVAAAVNEDFTYLLTVAENKMLKLWELPGLKLVNERYVILFSLGQEDIDDFDVSESYQRDQLDWRLQKTRKRLLFLINSEMSSGT